MAQKDHVQRLRIVRMMGVDLKIPTNNAWSSFDYTELDGPIGKIFCQPLVLSSFAFSNTAQKVNDAIFVPRGFPIMALRHFPFRLF